MKSTTVILMMVCLILSVAVSPGWAEKVLWDVISAGGIVGSNSTDYRLSGSVGQTGVELLEGSAFDVYSGFWNPWLIDQLGTEFRGVIDRPTTFRLSQIYPNPFARRTGIRYEVPSTGRVTVEIYDLQGRRVRFLVDEIHQPGYYLIPWDGRDATGRDLSSGIYLCRMKASAAGVTRYAGSKKLLLLK